MRNRKITTMFAILLFAASQGAYSQTERDTLQRELEATLEQVVNKKRRLQQASEYYERQLEMMKLEDAFNYIRADEGRPTSNLRLLRQQIDVEKRLDEARFRQTELRMLEEKIRRLQEALQSQEGEIDGQGELLRQLEEWKREDAQQTREALRRRRAGPWIRE